MGVGVGFSFIKEGSCFFIYFGIWGLGFVLGVEEGAGFLCFWVYILAVSFTGSFGYFYGWGSRWGLKRFRVFRVGG